MLIQKKNAGLLYMFAKKMKGNEVGVTFIETLVALAILGLIAAAFLSGLATGAKATLIADERATAESLARSQMEYVKSQDYVSVPWSYELPITPPDWDENHTLPPGYNGYTVSVAAEPLDGHDSDIQKITVTVNHGDKPVLTVDGYKVNRNEAE